MFRKIIINADDFGLCDGVNRAVLHAHSKGVLTSATIMTNMPAASDAVKIASQTPTLGVGIHLNLIEGKPLCTSPAIDCLLNSQGQFENSPARLSRLSLLSSGARKAIAAELTAQIQWAFDNGLTPTHLDSHQHVHCFPVIFSIVCKLAKQFNIKAVRWAFEPKQICSKPWPLTTEGGRNRAKIVRTLARINHLQNRDLLKTDSFLGVAHTGKIDVNFFRDAALYSRGQVIEIMTHPGYLDGLDSSKTRLLKQRELELDALCSEKTKRYLKDAKFELIHYGQL